MPRFSIKPPIAGGSKPVVVGAQVDAADAPQAGRDQILLGRLNEGGARRDVYFDVTSETVVAMFGKRGSGKSYSLGVLAESLVTKDTVTDIGAVTRNRAVLLIDTLNVFWTIAQPFDIDRDVDRFPDELSDLKQWHLDVPDLDVEVWVPRGAQDSSSPREYRELSISVSSLNFEEIQELTGLDPFSPSGQLMADAWGMAGDAASDFGISHVENVVENDPEIARVYSESTVRAVSQRLRTLADNPIFQAHGTEISQLLIPGRLAILEFGRLTDVQRSVLSAMLIRLIHRVRQEATDLEKHIRFDREMDDLQIIAARDRLSELIPPCWILVDEAQTVFPAERATKATDAFISFVKEGRNFGLSFGLATQQPAAVDQRILSQVDTVICHTLTVESDITRMQKNLKSRMPNEVVANGNNLDQSDWLRNLEPGQAIISNSDFSRTICVEIRPRISPHAGSGFSYTDS
jgi:uncharacterized protein